jgi:hypothetical protein
MSKHGDGFRYHATPMEIVSIPPKKAEPAKAEPEKKS